MPELGHSNHADENDAAFILEKYAAHLAQPDHQLWFEIGRGAGRGLIHDPTGRVHTWPEAEATHATMISVLGYEDGDCSRFYIEPYGVVSQIMGPSSAFTTIMNANPALASANGLDPVRPAG